MKNQLVKRVIFSCMMLFLAVLSYGQVNISSGNTISENFDAIGTTTTATLPTGWKMENITGVRTVTTAYASVSNTATANALTYNAAMSSTAGNGRWNFGGSSSTDRAIGGISSSSASQSVNMFVQLTNNGASSINSFTIGYSAERYRNGTNAAGFSIRFYYSLTGASSSWTEVTDLIASFSGGNADNNGATTNPMETINISNKTLSQSLSAGSSIYFAWSYSVTSGTTTSNAQALGIDNISIKANGISGPTITGAATTSAFITTYGTASTAQTFSISGSNLTDSLKAIAPYGFELSLDSTNYTDSVAIAQTSGTAAGRLSIRMKATDSVNGSYNSKSIVIKSAGATSVNITTTTTGNLVSAKALIIIGLNASNKDYDGTKTVSVTGSPSYSGLVNGQSFSVVGNVTWAFQDSSVGNNKTLVRTGSFSSPSSNYSITQPVLTASILAVVPGAPTIGSTIAGNNQATVSFTSPAFNGGANISTYTVTSSPDGITASGSSSPIIITGLTNGTAYTFTVTATNSVGNSISSAASNSVTPTSDPIVPNVPTAVSAVAGNAQATVSFLAPSSDGGSAILSYTVTSTPDNISVTAATSPIVVTGLTNGTTYSFTVVATNIIGNSLSSSSSNNVTPITICDSPTISSITIGNKQLTVQFSPPSSNGGSAITNYKYSINNGTSFVACSPTQTTSPITIKGLTNGVSYAIKILAVNSAGDGTPSNALTATPATTPGVPTITGITVGNNQLSVAYTSPSDSGSAIINYKYSINGGTTFISCSPAQTSSPIIITGLVNGTSYDVQLKAVNGVGDGAATGTTSATPLLPAPIARTASPIGSTTFTANWDSIPGATSYRLDVSNSTIFESTVVVLNEGFENSTFPPTGWLNSSWSRSTTTADISSGSASAIANSNSGSLTSPGISNPTSLTFYLGRSSNTTSKQLTIDVSTTSQSTGFSTIATFDHSNVPVSSYNQYTVDLRAYSSFSTVYIRFNKTSSTTSPWRLDDVVINSTLSNYLPGYQNLTVSGTSQLVSGLTNGATYYYRVRAYSASNTSVNSNVMPVATNNTINQPPVLANAPRATVDSAFTITFTEDSVWRNSITSVKVGGITLATSAYSILTPGQITFIPSASSLLQSSGAKSIVFVAADYANDTLSQSLLAGAPKSLAIVTQPTAPASNGGTLAVQPVVSLKDQYENLTTGNAMVTATSTDTSTWRIGGSTNVSAVSGVATFSGLTATSNAAVTAATISFSSLSLNGVISNAFNLPAPAPVNDNCSGAINLTVNTGAISGTLTASTPISGSSKNDVFYSFTPVITGSFTITINAFSASGDKDVYVYSLCPTTYSTTTNVVGSGTSTSTSTESVTCTLNAGVSYKILVRDFDVSGGTFNIAITGPAVYYSKSSGNLNKLSTWGINTDGSGTEPANFTSSNQTFIIKNNLAPTIDSAWIVSGSNSKIVLGDSINTYNFTIPSSYTLTGTIDVTSNANLTIQNATNPTFGILSATSTIDFASASSQSVPSANYGHITNTGNGPRVLASSGTIGIAGNYTPTSGTLTITGSTINLNGTSVQTIPGSNYNNITVSNTAGAVTGGDVIVNGTLLASQNVTIGSGHSIKLNGANALLNVAASKTISVNGSLYNQAGNVSISTISSSTTTATVTTTLAHGLTVGQKVLISGNLTSTYNVSTPVNIVSVPNSTTFTYNISSFSGSGTGGVVAVYPFTVANAAAVNFNAGSSYFHAQNGGYILNSAFTSGVTYNNNATMNITGVTTSMPFLPTSCPNVVWNCVNQTQQSNFMSTTPVTINGNLNIQSTGSSGGYVTVGQSSTARVLNINGNLTVEGGKLFVLGNSTGTVNQTLNLFGNLTVTDGVLNLNAGTSSGNSTLNLYGNLTHTGGIITETNSNTGKGLMVFRGSSTQTISSVGFSNKPDVTINNASGVSLSTDFSIGGTLTFTAGKITTGNNKLMSTGAISGAGIGGWVVGNLQKKITAIGSINFEIGGTDFYRPINMNVLSLIDTGNVTASVSQQDNNHPNILSSMLSTRKVLKRYFNLTKSNSLSATYNAVFNYNTSDISGTSVFDSSKILVGNYNTAWSYPVVGSKTNSSIQILNTSTFGDFAIGETNQFDSIRVEVKAFLEGFYSGNGLMQALLNDAQLTGNGIPISADSTATDSVTISLWKTDSLTNPNPAYRLKTILHKNGTTAFLLHRNTFLDKSYYISIDHRNSIQTWSAVPVLLSTTNVSYDFSSSLSAAYSDGNNPPMKYMGNGVYALYGGDVNQDGTVDGFDLQATENDASEFAYGYNATDCTGDGASDGFDMQLIENNSALFLFTARP